ncbi:MAG: hypothetical protein DRP42_02230 [Tenericutes bacterium]|nr:MAG: hypothetical protein DRP42_02230 [Mycoplasmatota bacterium]
MISKADQIKLQKGVTLANGYTTQPLAGFKPLSFGDNESSFKMVLTEGKQNQIKKMFQALDSEVINLKRVQIGQMKIDSLPTGQYAKYTKEKLFQLLGIT